MPRFLGIPGYSSAMPRPPSWVELRLGLDCALKLRYARAGLPHKSAEEDRPCSFAGARELVVAHYWACHAPVVDAREATGARLRRLLARAVTDARSTGSPVRVRGATFRAGDTVPCAEELVVRPDRLEVAEIHPKRMPESPAASRMQSLSRSLKRRRAERWASSGADSGLEDGSFGMVDTPGRPDCLERWGMSHHHRHVGYPVSS